MKKFFLILALALIAGGAVCMSYSTYWVFDALGAFVLIVGCALATVYTIKTVKKKPTHIALLCALYTAVVLLLIAGAVTFSGTILLAILGSAALILFGFPLARFNL